MFTYLLGALCGLFREVVVGVVSLRDATKQHGHNACRTTYTHTYTHTQPAEIHNAKFQPSILFLLSQRGEGGHLA